MGDTVERRLLLPAAEDSASGLPTYRNGGAVLAAVQVHPDGLFVVLVEREPFEFVTATTVTGAAGWSAGRYFQYSVSHVDVVDPARREAQWELARADFLVRCAGRLADPGRERFAADLRSYCEDLALRVVDVMGAGWLSSVAADPETDCMCDGCMRARETGGRPACGSDPRGGYACALGHFHVPAGYTDADARDADYQLPADGPTFTAGSAGVLRGDDQ